MTGQPMTQVHLCVMYDLTFNVYHVSYNFGYCTIIIICKNIIQNNTVIGVDGFVCFKVKYYTIKFVAKVNVKLNVTKLIH